MLLTLLLCLPAPLESSPDEESTPAELEEEKRQQNSETDISKEDERNSLEERGPRSREVGSQDGKESAAGFKSHEMGEFAELPWDDAIDNHLHADTRDEDAAEQRHHEGQEPAETDERDDLEEEEEEEEEAHISKTSEEESKEEVDDSVRDQTDEEEENEEEDRGTSEEEHPTSSEDDQRDDGTSMKLRLNFDSLLSEPSALTFIMGISNFIEAYKTLPKHH